MILVACLVFDPSLVPWQSNRSAEAHRPRRVSLHCSPQRVCYQLSSSRYQKPSGSRTKVRSSPVLSRTR